MPRSNWTTAGVRHTRKRFYYIRLKSPESAVLAAEIWRYDSGTTVMYNPCGPGVVNFPGGEWERDRQPLREPPKP